MRSQTRAKPVPRDMLNPKRAKQMPGEKSRDISQAERTQNVAGDIGYERKLKRTTKRMCKACMYHCMIGSNGMAYYCYYIVYTGERRDCPIGYCDKFKKGKPKRDKFN